MRTHYIDPSNTDKSTTKTPDIRRTDDAGSQTLPPLIGAEDVLDH